VAIAVSGKRINEREVDVFSDLPQAMILWDKAVEGEIIVQIAPKLVFSYHGLLPPVCEGKTAHLNTIMYHGPQNNK